MSKVKKTKRIEKILVTGADGFIGSHLSEALVSKGYAVRSMVMYNAFGYRGRLDLVDEKIMREMEIFPADIRDQGRVREAMDGISHVFHLASLIGIPYSYHAAESYVATNVQGTLNLLQASVNHQVAQFIHTSTSEVYGSAQATPMDESHPQVGQSPYAASKIAADQMVTAFGLSHDLPVTTIRPFNTYGPRQSARAIIPTIITQIASDQKRIRLGSTRPRRDFCFVTDMVSGFMAALDNDRTIGRTINLGSGSDISIGELADLIAKLMNASVEIETDSLRIRPERSEVDRLLADNTLARDLLAWQPSIDLTNGLSRTIDYFSNPDILKSYHPETYEL